MPYRSLDTSPDTQVSSKGATIRFPGGGGRSICRGQIIYFNRARRRAENFIFCYMFIWNSSWVNYLFHAESAKNYLFQKYSCPPPPGNLMVAP